MISLKWQRIFLDLKKSNNQRRILFALPQNNHYQEIKNIYFSSPPFFLSDKWGNLIAFFENSNTKETISFFHAPKKVKRKILGKRNEYPPYLFYSYSYLLKPNKFINGKNPKILKIVEKWQKEEKLEEILKKIYYFLLNNLKYGDPISGLYTSQQALEYQKVDCGGFSTLALSLFQALDIPARLVVGFLVKTRKIQKIFPYFLFPLNFYSLQMHVWIEVLLPNGSWFPLDPSIEWRRKHNLTLREGGFGFIPADRLVVSFGQDFKIKIKEKVFKIDLLQYPLLI